MSGGLPEPSGVAAGVLAQSVAAVAQAVSLVEDRRAEAEPRTLALLAELRRSGRARACHRVGVTGPPGVGKSTLVSALALAARSRGRRVGVLAVDPSSPRSGGALLGDRARMQLAADDEGLFVRSMASGEQLGGLARAAGAAVEVLSAAFDLVLIETTGVGQSETDVEHVADTVVVVIQPASGDVLQFIKAGIIEIPDVLVVNKADLGELAERASAEVSAALVAIHAGRAEAMPPVLRTSAATTTGVGELLDVLDRRWDRLVDGGGLALQQRREQAATAWAYRLLGLRYGEEGVRRAGGRAKVVARLRALVDEGTSAVEAAAALGNPWL